MTHYWPKGNMPVNVDHHHIFWLNDVEKKHTRNHQINNCSSSSSSSSSSPSSSSSSSSSSSFFHIFPICFPESGSYFPYVSCTWIHMFPAIQQPPADPKPPSVTTPLRGIVFQANLATRDARANLETGRARFAGRRGQTILGIVIYIYNIYIFIYL